MTHVALVILILIVWFTGRASAEPLEQGAIRAALERDSVRLASTRVAFDRSLGAAPGHTVPTPPERTDDWKALRRLRAGTRVVVATSRVQGIKGRTALVTEDELHLVDRRGADHMLRREDIGEVHLDTGSASASMSVLGYWWVALPASRSDRQANATANSVDWERSRVSSPGPSEAQWAA